MRDDPGIDRFGQHYGVRTSCPPPSRHKGFFSSKAATAVEASYLKGGETTGRANRNRDLLTPHERKFVQLLADEKSYKAIAATLRLSLHTVETHRRNVMLKLGTHSLSGLIRYAVGNKIVQAQGRSRMQHWHLP